MGDDAESFAPAFPQKKVRKSRSRKSNGGNFYLWGELLSLFEIGVKNLIFFSEMVGRVGIEPTTN
jgi:hypothetical protein